MNGKLRFTNDDKTLAHNKINQMRKIIKYEKLKLVYPAIVILFFCLMPGIAQNMSQINSNNVNLIEINH